MMVTLKSYVMTDIDDYRTAVLHMHLHMRAVSQTCFDAGTAKCTYGTGAFILMNTGHTIVPRLAISFSFQL
jgi:hypothetical protein